jgi:hypothetical protein
MCFANFEVFLAVKNSVLWAVALTESFGMHVLYQHTNKIYDVLLALTFETSVSYKTFVYIYQTKRHLIRDDLYLYYLRLIELRNTCLGVYKTMFNP